MIQKMITAITKRIMDIPSSPSLRWCLGGVLAAVVEVMLAAGAELLLMLTIESGVDWSGIPPFVVVNRVVAVPGCTLLPASVLVPEPTRL